jgi:hypothetical protein
MSEDKKEGCCGDELIAGPELSNGLRPFIRHNSKHGMTGGLMKTAKNGQPVNGSELVQLTKIEGERYAVESLYDGMPLTESTESDRSGPSKVVSNKYRDGWDRIFGSGEIGQA